MGPTPGGTNVIPVGQTNARDSEDAGSWPGVSMLNPVLTSDGLSLWCPESEVPTVKRDPW